MFKHFPNGSEFAIQQDHDNIVLFDGNDDRLSFLLPANEMIISTGHNQTLSLAKAGDGTSVLDMGQGLTLNLVATEFGSTKIYGLEHDLTAHVLVTQGVTLAADGHGGTLLYGFAGGGTFDFVGDNHVQMSVPSIV